MTCRGLVRAAGGLAVAMVLFVAVTPRSARAAGPIVADSSCADESTYKSLKGDTPAALQVFNKSPIPVKVFWLDYNGKRVFYQELPAFTFYTQKTWLTHPWVITDDTGRCLRFLVMTSQLQAVTVEGEPPDPETTALPLSARATAAPTAAPTPTAAATPTAAPTPMAAPAGTPAAATPTAGPATTPTETSGGGSNTGLLAAAAVAAVVMVAGASLAASGRLPGLGRGGKPG